MKTGVAFYYKNIERYNPAWVNKCIDSMRNQTYQDFDVYVLNYGEKENHSFNFSMGKRYHFLHKPLDNHADATNEVYAWIFETCDVAVNVHLDDYYSPKRIEVLLQLLNNGADVASSNMHIVNEHDVVTWSLVYSKMNIAEKLNQGYNPVSNPCHVMKKRVFDHMKFDSSLVPIEDMDYWQRAIKYGFKIVISNKFLHFYRMHEKQSTHTYKKEAEEIKMIPEKQPLLLQMFKKLLS